jgi:Leu/Phe-tRNA-protein transferase
MTEQDPLFLSDEEQERVLKLTDQFSWPQALRKVLGNERYRRYAAADARRAVEKSVGEARAQREAREQEAAERHIDDSLQLMRETNPDSDADNQAA